uniref:Uncharacterized protein n=1 Tax=Arundo donax TaxID=35708 RepID=A0A0A9Q4I9_ARUDO
MVICTRGSYSGSFDWSENFYNTRINKCLIQKDAGTY